MKKELKIYLASPRGFCAGVKRAIEIVEKSLNKYGKPVYVRHEIVHNKQVVEDLKKREQFSLRSFQILKIILDRLFSLLTVFLKAFQKKLSKKNYHL